MYKANFCAECGERLTHAGRRRRFLTGKRFCSSCAQRFGKRPLLWPLLATAALFTLGFAAGRAGRPKPAPLIIERTARESPSQDAGRDNAAQPPEGRRAADTSAQTAPNPYGPDGSSSERPTEPGEIVSICGARTKKGTPCQRRVRGTGRCWQHKGQPAMIPLEQRLIAEK